MLICTGFSSEIGTKLRDWAAGQAVGSCYSWAALSSNDSKTLYLQFTSLKFIMHLSKGRSERTDAALT